MKNFVINLSFVILVFAVAFLGVRLVNYQADLRQLQSRLEERERERVGLLRQLTTPANTVTNAFDPEDLRRSLEQAVCKARWLDFKEPLNYRTVPPARLRQVAADDVRQLYTPAELQDYTRSLAAWGFIPADTDLVAAWLSIYEGEIGAYYRWRDKTVYVADNLELTNGVHRLILARELALVLKHQNWGIAGMLQPVKDDDDRNLAHAAFLQGDTMLVLSRLYEDTPERAGLLRDIATLGTDYSNKLRDVPLYLRKVMLFPYQEGLACATLLESRLRFGFWPPTTTEQVLHPDKTRLVGGARSDEPTPVTLTPVDSTTWRLINNNVLGEFRLHLLLAARLTQIDADVAVQGWDGDRYQVYERGVNGPTGIIWRSIWDTEADAEEFEEAFRSFIRKTQSPTRIARDGVYVNAVQSRDPSFADFANDVLKANGVTGFDTAAAP